MTRLFLPLLLLISGPAAHAQWVNISEPNRSYTDFAVNGSVLVATNVGGNGQAVLTSTDLGGTWAESTPGVYRSARNVAATPSGFVIQIDGNHDFLGDATGFNWTGIAGVGGNTTSFFRDGATGALFVTTQDLNLRVSTDDGATWSDMGVSSLDAELSWVHARGNTILTAYNQFNAKTFLSFDGGANWTDTGLGSSSAGFVAKDGRLYVLTSPFSVGNVPGVLMRSSDAGVTWEVVTTPPSLGGFFGQQSTPLRQNTLLFVSGNSIIYAPNDRVYVSHDDGASFQDMSEGLVAAGARQSAVRRMQIVGSDMFILVVNTNEEAPTSQGYGLFRRPLSELGFDPTTVSTESIDLPSIEVSIWPNPSSGTGSLTVNAVAGEVKLALFDLLGRQVHQEIYGGLSGGPATLTWSALGLPSGVYAVRVQTGDGAETRMLTILK